MNTHCLSTDLTIRYEKNHIKHQRLNVSFEDLFRSGISRVLVELEWPEQPQQYSREKGLYQHKELSAEGLLKLRSGIYYKAYA